MDFEEIEVAPPRAKEVRIKVKHNPDFHVIPKMFSGNYISFPEFPTQKESYIFLLSRKS